jgi:hypothetical protein
MLNYNEFRLELVPDVGLPGQWKVQLVNCPIGGLAGPKGTVAPSFTRDQLKQLRRATAWAPPPANALETIGRSVWKSLMSAEVEAAFRACVQVSRDAKKGLRVIIAMIGQAGETFGGEGIWPSELPVEALFEEVEQFLATNPETPVSRSLQRLADRAPHKVPFPLRMLVVVATPKDKGDVKAADEVKVIQEALKPLTGPGGTLVLEFCEPATKQQLYNQLLNKPYHILHFVGHGGFAPIDDVDPTSQAHICLVREDDPQTSDPLDARTLLMLLRNTEVRLVVFTSCASAQVSPDEKPYRVTAFDGLAQRLLSGVSSVSAIVAMQFDLETDSAKCFSQAFYRNLLAPGRALDEVVTLARDAMLLKMRREHRAWVNPVVYWRCKDGKVFDLDTILPPTPDDATLREIELLRRERERAVRHLEDMTRQPPTISAALKEMRDRLSAQIADFDAQIGTLLGESVRLWGGRVPADQEIVCRLTLRLRLPAVIDLVQLNVQYPADRLQLIAREVGQHCPGNVPVVQDGGAGQLQVTVVTPSAWVPWQAEEYEIGRLRFKVIKGEPAIMHLKIDNVGVRRGGVTTAFKALDGVVFREATA